MNKKQHKRRQRLHLTFIYSLMVLTVLFSVAIAAYLIQGYRVNWRNGTVEQGGLVQFDSYPTDASVTVDKISLSNTTPSKITLSAGKRTVSMQRDGYHTWNKTVNVTAGGVLWLDYARLVSTNLSHKTIAKAGSVASAAASGNSTYIAYIETANKPTVRLANVSGDEPKISTITLNESVYTQSSHSDDQAFVIDSWDKDNRYVLIKHTYDNKTEWLVLDTRGDYELKNLTKQLGVEASKIQFSQSDSKKFLMLTGEGDLRQGNIADSTISGPLVSDVDEFSLYSDNTVAYTTKLNQTTKSRNVGYLTLGASKPRTVRSYADDGTTPLHFRIEKYYNEIYYVIAYGDTTEILKGPYVDSGSKSALSLKTIANISLPGGVKTLGFSPGGHRFVCVYNDTSLLTYDLELLAAATVKLSTPLTRDVNWVDSHHFTLANNDGSLNLYEFDGANSQQITSGALDLPVLLSTNQKYIYSFVKNNGAVILRQTKIVNS